MEKDKINYSIIIPHYNSFEKLQRLIKSIPNRSDLEIIIVDDRTPNFDLKSMNNRKNIKVLINNIGKKGAGTCRNIGIDNSIGKWLIFADADDYFSEEFSLKLDEYLDSDIDLIFFKIISYYENSNKIAKRHLVKNLLIDEYLEKKETKKRDRLIYKYQVPWGKFIKREYIIKNNIRYSEIIASNDIYFAVKSAYFATKLHVDDSIIYCVTDSECSLTKNKTQQVAEIRLMESLKINEFLKNIDKKHCQYNMIVHLKRMSTFGINELFKTIIKIYSKKSSIFSGITLHHILFLLKLKSQGGK